MRLRTALTGIALGLGALGCSSIEGVEFRLGGATSGISRAIVASAAQELGFAEAVGKRYSAHDEYYAERSSAYDSWPLTLSTQVRGGVTRVFVGRRNIGLTQDEQVVIVNLIRKIQARGATLVVERSFGVRLPEDLQPLLANKKP